MTRSELIEKLTLKHPHLSQDDIECVVLTVFNDIAQALINKNRVELRGFGAFSLREREAREGRNPKTGEKVKVDTRYSVMFKAGKELRNRLNANDNQVSTPAPKTAKTAVQKRVPEPA